MGKKKDKPSIKKSASQKQKLKNRLKGKINIDDNIFGEHWNKDLTVYENYAKLGIIVRFPSFHSSSFSSPFIHFFASTLKKCKKFKKSNA